MKMIAAIAWAICMVSAAFAQGEGAGYHREPPHALATLPFNDDERGTQPPSEHIPPDDNFFPIPVPAESEAWPSTAEGFGDKSSGTIVPGHVPTEDVSRPSLGGDEAQSKIEGQPHAEPTASQSAPHAQAYQQGRESETALLPSRPHADYPRKIAPIFTGNFQSASPPSSVDEPTLDSVRAQQLGFEGEGFLPLARNAPIFLIALIIVAIAVAAYITLR